MRDMIDVVLYQEEIELDKTYEYHQTKFEV